MAAVPLARSKHLLAAGLLSIFLSGMASLTAQTVLQRYISTVFGGMDVVIMAVVSFSFIAGIGAGTLLGGALCRKAWRSSTMWAAVEICCSLVLVLFIPIFGSVHSHALTWITAQAADNAHLYYYAYLFAMQFCSSFLLATVMGMNYPLALVSLARACQITPHRLAMLVLALNTLGAAIGSYCAPQIMVHHDLHWLIWAAAVLYGASGVLALFITPATGTVVADPSPEPGTASTLRPSVAFALLFLGGAAGFSFEVVVFRHFTLSHVRDHTVFGTALALYLVFWSLGTLLARVRSGSLQSTMGFYLLTLVASCAMLFLPLVGHIHFQAKDWMSYPLVALFFLPALMSGWFFSQVHDKVGDGNVRRFAHLYFCNLAGSFVGGVVTKYLFPQWLSFTYVLLLWSLALGLGLYLLYSSRKGLVVTALAVCVLGPWGKHHLRYYASFNKAENLVEVKEDWASAAWLTDKNFIVDNRAQLGNPYEPFYGFRMFQVAIALQLKANQDIFICGTALGCANGAIGHFLPSSRVVSVDYSPAVRYFARKYHDLNFDLTRQVNGAFHVTDARLQLTLEQKPFDIVMEFCSDEAMPGISTIKSLEFMRVVKQKLRPGGVYIGVGASCEFAATLQHVFKNVYKTPTYPFFVATDSELEDLLDDAQLQAASQKDPRITRALLGKDQPRQLVRLKPVRARLVTDADPCADYGWDVITILDLERFGDGHVIQLPGVPYQEARVDAAPKEQP